MKLRLSLGQKKHKILAGLIIIIIIILKKRKKNYWDAYNYYIRLLTPFWDFCLKKKEESISQFSLPIYFLSGEFK